MGWLIKEMLDKMLGVERRIGEIEAQMRCLRLGLEQVNAARFIEDACYNAVVNLSVSWVHLTQTAGDLASILDVIGDNPSLEPILIDDARKSWVELRAHLDRW
jgi:hypothetical protein